MDKEIRTNPDEYARRKAEGKPEMSNKALRRAKALAATALVGLGGLVGNMTGPKPAENSDIGKAAGESAGQAFAPEITDEVTEKAVSMVSEDEDRPSVDPLLRENGAYESAPEFRNGGGMPSREVMEESGNPDEDQPEAPSQPETSDPAAEETRTYEESEAFENNDGNKAVKAEQEEFESKASSAAGDRDAEGNPIDIDPATSQQIPPPESAQEQP